LQRPVPTRPPVRRHEAADRPVEQHPSGPLDLTPRRSGRVKAWLAVLFVLLTLAAVLIAIMILRETSPGGDRTEPLGTGPGTVAEAAGPVTERPGPAGGRAPLTVTPSLGGPEVPR